MAWTGAAGSLATAAVVAFHGVPRWGSRAATSSSFVTAPATVKRAPAAFQAALFVGGGVLRGDGGHAGDGAVGRAAVGVARAEPLGPRDLGGDRGRVVLRHAEVGREDAALPREVDARELRAEHHIREKIEGGAHLVLCEGHLDGRHRAAGAHVELDAELLHRGGEGAGVPRAGALGEEAIGDGGGALLALRIDGAAAGHREGEGDEREGRRGDQPHARAVGERGGLRRGEGERNLGADGRTRREGVDRGRGLDRHHGGRGRGLGGTREEADEGAGEGELREARGGVGHLPSLASGGVASGTTTTRAVSSGFR